jgi:aspartate aminotransferase/aminotransferase
MRISNRALKVRSSGIRRMFDLASRLQDPLDLSIGQPHFDVPEAAQEAAVAAIRGGSNRYTVTQGLPALNAAILDGVERRTGVRPEASLVTSGVAGGLTLSMIALLDAGESVLIPDPYFVCYRNLAEMLSCVPRPYDTYPDFRITEERLEAAMHPGARVLIVNSPANPTGRVLAADELDLIARFAGRHDLVVVSDEIYDAFSFDGPAPSMFGRYEQTVLLGGFSKTYGMPGWRLGWAVGPGEVIDRMRTLQQFSFVCAPAPLQHGALAALETDVSAWIEAYRVKRDLVWERLRGCYDLVRPEGAFYAFPAAPAGMSGTGFAEAAVQRNTLVVPGAAFSDRDTHLRISFALPDDRLGRALDVLIAIAGEALLESTDGHGSG